MRYLLLSALFLLFSYGSCFAQATAKPISITINIPAHRLYICEQNHCIASYPVAVGKPHHETPTGKFSVISKVKDPDWTDPKDTSIVVPAGVDNPLGQRWIGIGGDYGIHGTNVPSSVGKYASHGCVRMHESDVEKVFAQVSIGTPVHIIYQRFILGRNAAGEFTYQIFGDGYNKEPLSLEKVNAILQSAGIADFINQNTLCTALDNANGTVYNTGIKLITLYVDGQKMPFYAIHDGNAVYINAQDLAAITDTPIYFNNNHIMSEVGTGSGIVKNNHPYIDVTSLEKVFHLQRNWVSPELLQLNPTAD